jgi:hypothetical protein
MTFPRIPVPSRPRPHFRGELLHLVESLLQVRRLHHAELQIQEWRQTRRDLWMKLARIYIRDQLVYGVANRPHVVQFGQWTGNFRGNTSLFPATNSAKLSGFGRISVKKTQAAGRRCSPAEIALFGMALTARIRIVRSHLLFQTRSRSGVGRDALRRSQLEPEVSYPLPALFPLRGYSSGQLQCA